MTVKTIAQIARREELQEQSDALLRAEVFRKTLRKSDSMNYLKFRMHQEILERFPEIV